MNRVEFKHSYIRTALWSTNDESDPSGGVPMDDNYGIDDIDPATLNKLFADCDKFCDLMEGLHKFIGDGFDPCNNPNTAGHDFWLTQNGHGAGFWDGDWPEDVGTRLTEASKTFPEVNLYVGDDGKIYA